MCYNFLAMIYLDYAANYPVRDEVLQTFLETEKEYIGNSNSSHIEGNISHEKYLSLAQEVLHILNLDENAYDVIFTSGATESNNLAIKGIYESYNGFGNTLLSSEFEHSSVNAVLAYLKDRGAAINLISTNPNGKLSTDDLNNKLTDDCLLLCLTAVESEVGTPQDYQEVQHLLSSSNCRLLLDVTQAIGKMPLNLNGIDMISFGAHKFGGIIGTGVLIKKKEIIITPLMHGGKAESPYRSGTTPLGLDASLVKALSLAISEQEESYKKVKELSEYLRKGMLDIPGIKLNSFDENPYINNFSYECVSGGEIVKYLSSKGICISQKSACSIPQSPSKVINAIYHDKQRALSSFRISLSRLTTKEDISTLLEAIRSYDAK